MNNDMIQSSVRPNGIQQVLFYKNLIWWYSTQQITFRKSTPVFIMYCVTVKHTVVITMFSI